MDDGVEDLVISHLPLARRLARRNRSAWRRSAEDALADAVLGLCDAATRWRNDRGGAPFASFARRRIEGELVDQARRQGPFKRAEAQDVRALAMAEVHANGDTDALPGILGWDLARIDRARIVSSRRHVQAVDRGGGDNPDPVIGIHVRSALDTLGDRDREIVYRLYWLDQTLAEVGEALGVTESRVSQIRARILNAMRSQASC